ncbi:MAG: transposase [Gammaproteobacteria bacterium]
MVINGYHAVKFLAPKSACRLCSLRTQCLKHPDRSKVRQVHFFARHRISPKPLKRKIDSPPGRMIYGRRLATVEPVFANIASMLGLNSFHIAG